VFEFATEGARTYAEHVESFQRHLITKAVSAHAGNWAKAAKSLGMHRANLHAVAKRLALK